MLKGYILEEPTIECTAAGMYVIDPDDLAVYIGDWCVDSDILYHRHPDEYAQGFTGVPGQQEYDVNDRVCWKCDERCPDAVWLIHKLYQL